jgi:hypothetical protein
MTKNLGCFWGTFSSLNDMAHCFKKLEKKLKMPLKKNQKFHLFQNVKKRLEVLKIISFFLFSNRK